MRASIAWVHRHRQRNTLPASMVYGWVAWVGGERFRASWADHVWPVLH